MLCHDFMSPLISFFFFCALMSLLLSYFTSVVKCITRNKCILFIYFILALLGHFLPYSQKFDLKWSQ